MNDTAMAAPLPVPRQRCQAMKELRSRHDVPAWVADLLSDTGKGKPKSPHFYDQGHDAWPFVGRMHWKALVRYAHLPAESKAIAAWSFDQRLPTVRPSKATIMGDSGVSDRAVNMAIDVLEWLGFVDVVPRGGASNEYFLTFPLVDTTRLITRPDPAITPLHSALKAVTEGRMPESPLLDMTVLAPPAPGAVAPPEPATADDFASAWALFPAAYRGSESTARRKWEATVAAIVAEGGTPDDAGAVLLAATKTGMWCMDQEGTPAKFRARPPRFFDVDGDWRKYVPGGACDPNRSPVLVDGVEVW